MPVKKAAAKKTVTKSPSALGGLKPQQALFIQLLHAQKTKNQTQAAIDAGYSPKTAHATASRMLKDVKVAAYYSELQAKTSQTLSISADRVAQEYARMAFFNIGDYMTFDDNGTAVVDLSKASKAQLAGLTSLKCKSLSIKNAETGAITTTSDVKFGLSKATALKALGDHLGFFDKEVVLDADAMTVLISAISKSGSKPPIRMEE